ncbi:MAG TPA: hypothetical protein VHS05_21375 [Pyrinomonadaceae bacterium]|nr:hypothetical protein [Pyrinomonadaceae bacterium]
MGRENNPRAAAPAVRKAEKPRLERPARHAVVDDRSLEVLVAVVAVLDFRRVKLVARQHASRLQQ